MKKILILLITFSSTFCFAQKVEFLYGQAEIHYSHHEFEEALIDINKAIEKKSKFYDAYLLRAKIYADSDRFDKALAELDYIIENFPAPDEAYFQKGMLLYDEEKYEKALPNFNEATKLYFNDPEYFYYQGETAFHLKLLPEACTAWDKGAKLNDGEDNKDIFDENCEGIVLIEPEPVEINNPFKKN